MVFGDVFRVLKRRAELGHRLRKKAAEGRKQPAAIVFLGDLASSAFQRDIGGYAVAWALAGLFLLSFALGIRSFYLPQTVLIALMCCGMPPAIMSIAVSRNRSRSSREGMSLVAELGRQYRIHGKNIYSAIEYTIESEADFPVSKKQLYRLLLRLRSASGKDSIKACTDSFAFSLGTIWGSMLASCIRLAAEKGSDISEGLSDISRQLSSAYKRSEERRRMNSEATRMTLFLVPLLYVGTVLMAVYYLGISPGQLLSNQFLSPEGLLFFLIGVFLFVINIAVLRALSNMKLDY